MWFRRHARQSSAVLAALAQVGQPGMTANALAIAVNIPENQLLSILDELTRAGLVSCSSDVDLLSPHVHTYLARSHYHLATPTHLIPRQRNRRAGTTGLRTY